MHHHAGGVEKGVLLMVKGRDLLGSANVLDTLPRQPQGQQKLVVSGEEERDLKSLK